MAEFVQRWLFLDMNSHWVEMGVLVAAVAVFQHGVLMNWTKWVTRRLYQLVEDVKYLPIDSTKTFSRGYYVTKILDVVKAIPVSRMKTEAGEGTLELLPTTAELVLGKADYYQRMREEAGQLEMLATHPTIFED